MALSTSRADIVVTDPIPAQTTFISATGPGWDCPAPVAGVLTCTLDADLPINDPTDQIVVSVRDDSGATGTITNSATVTSTTTNDPVPANNTKTVPGPVTTSADLSIDKRSIGTLVAGETAVYRLRVDNLGPSDAAPTVRITDTLPAGLTFVSATSVVGEWTCVVATPAVAFACDLPILRRPPMSTSRQRPVTSRRSTSRSSSPPT